MARKTRSGCGIAASTRPLAAVTPASPCSALFGFWIAFGRLALDVGVLKGDVPVSIEVSKLASRLNSARPSPWTTGVGNRAPAMPASQGEADALTCSRMARASKPARWNAAAISIWPFTPCSRKIATRGRTPVAIAGAAVLPAYVHQRLQGARVGDHVLLGESPCETTPWRTSPLADAEPLPLRCLTVNALGRDWPIQLARCALGWRTILVLER